MLRKVKDFLLLVFMLGFIGELIAHDFITEGWQGPFDAVYRHWKIAEEGAFTRFQDKYWKKIVEDTGRLEVELPIARHTEVEMLRGSS